MALDGRLLPVALLGAGILSAGAAVGLVLEAHEAEAEYRARLAACVAEWERAAAWQAQFLGEAPPGEPADRCPLKPRWHAQPLALGGTALCFSLAFFLLAYGHRPAARAKGGRHSRDEG